MRWSVSPGAHGTSVTIAVKDGVVQMDGCLFDLHKREALGVLAEGVPGGEACA